MERNRLVNIQTGSPEYSMYAGVWEIHFSMILNNKFLIINTYIMAKEGFTHPEYLIRSIKLK